MTGSAVPSGAMKKLGVFHPGPLTTAHVPMCRTLENYFVVSFLLFPTTAVCTHCYATCPSPPTTGVANLRSRVRGGGRVAQAFPFFFVRRFSLDFRLFYCREAAFPMAWRRGCVVLSWHDFRSACGLFGRTKEVPLCRPCTTWHVKKASGGYLGHCCFRARFVAVFVVVCDTTPRPFWFVTSQPQVTSGWPRQRRTSTSWMPLPMLSR